MSKCTPITARAKQSPFKANSSLIEGAAKVYGSVEGKPKEVKKTKKSKYKGPKMSDEEWRALTPEQRRRFNANVGANEQGEIITETTETVPGEDLNYSTELKKAVKGDVFFAADNRMQNRIINKQYRNEQSARIRAARKAGTLTKEKRKEIKADVARKRAAEKIAATDRGRQLRKSGLAPGSSGAYLYDRTVSLGERSFDEQRNQAKQEAIRNNTKTNYFSGSFEDFLNKPGGPKMRSGFKMKGYGKKK